MSGAARQTRLTGIPGPDAPLRLAVFDCDGTLVDGQADICAAMAAAFTGLGVAAPDDSRIRRAVGLSLPQAMRLLMPDAEPMLHTALVEAYKAAFRLARAEGRLAEPLFPGIAAAIARLRAAGWDLAVATGKSHRGLTHCLAVHGLSDAFASLQTADHHPSKPHPAMLFAALDATLATPEQAVMIGDTAYDIQMARAAGVAAIGVAWGYHTPAELRAAGALAVAENAAELVEMLG